MSATNANRNYRKFKRAANAQLKRAGAARKKTSSMIANENGIGTWWLGQARSVAKQIRRETH